MTTPKLMPQPVRVESVGRPACVSRLAAMMLRLHQQQNARPALRLITTPASNDDPSRAVPEIEQGSL